jgi:murein DD-endopeptidase MepM/ murein hydrolase activator NlpD
MRRPTAATLVALAIVGSLAIAPAPASATAIGVWLRPVAGRVVRPFRPPVTRYGRGHLGVDFSAVSGTPVRAAGAGTVVFAGAVAGALHVVVRHAGGLRTSYSFLAGIRVHRGERVGRGAVLGTTGGRREYHDGHVLHLGLRIGDAYVDPMRLFAPGGLAVRVHLALPSAGPASRAALVAVCGRWVALGCESPARARFRTG